MNTYTVKINQALNLLSQAQKLLKQVNTSVSVKAVADLNELKENLKNEVVNIVSNQEVFLLKELELAEKTENNVYKTTKLGIKYWSVVQTTNKQQLKKTPKGSERSSLQSVVAKNRNRLKDLHGKLNALKIERASTKSSLQLNEQAK